MSNRVWSPDKGWHDGEVVEVSLDDRGRIQSTPVDYGVTDLGTTVVPGLIVFTNEMRVGKVVEGSMREHNPGWFDVEYRNGSKIMMNATRVSTTFHPYKGDVEFAIEEYYRAHDWTFPNGERLCALCGTTIERPPGVPYPCPKAPKGA